MAAAALVLGAGAAEIAAEAEERDHAGSGPRPRPTDSGARPPVPSVFVLRRREPTRRRRVIPLPESAAALAQPAALDGGPEDSEEGASPASRSELREWIKDNATLLSNASLLISLATIALSLLPDVGFFAPYIKALIFAAALLLLTELHHQWPADLQLHVLRKNVRPENHSWRMIGFAVVMQVATLFFAAWATLTNPIILLPLTALGVIAAFYRWYFRRYRGMLARIFGVIALLVVLLLSELLMVVVWAVLTGEEVTIELWTEDQPGLQFEQR
jgi:hypothetical protein